MNKPSESPRIYFLLKVHLCTLGIAQSRAWAVQFFLIVFFEDCVRDVNALYFI